jgi:holo-[acyl-carrier protein] synthase
MIYGVGTDIIEVNRIRKAMERYPKFVDRLFSDEELIYYESKQWNPQNIAGGFSAKEAVLKAIGTGLHKFKWKEIEIIRDNKGKPFVRLNGRVKQYVDDNYIGLIHVSVTHCREYAAATAVAEVSLEKRWMDIESMLISTNEESRRNIH